MHFVKLLGIVLTLAIVSSLTSSADAGVGVGITLSPSFGPAGTIVQVTGVGFDPEPTNCIISSSPSGLISNAVCMLSGGDIVSASFTVGCAPAGPYTITVTDSIYHTPSYEGSFNNEGGTCAVGGIVEPVNTFALVSPWLAVIGVVGCICTAIVVAKPRKKPEN